MRRKTLGLATVLAMLVVGAGTAEANTLRKQTAVNKTAKHMKSFYNYSQENPSESGTEYVDWGVGECTRFSKHRITCDGIIDAVDADGEVYQCITPVNVFLSHSTGRIKARTNLNGIECYYGDDIPYE